MDRQIALVADDARASVRLVQTCVEPSSRLVPAVLDEQLGRLESVKAGRGARMDSDVARDRQCSGIDCQERTGLEHPRVENAASFEVRRGSGPVAEGNALLAFDTL